MKFSLKTLTIGFAALLIAVISNVNVKAGDDASGLSIGSESYLSYETQLDKNDGLVNGKFKVNRSYITIKKSLFDNIGFRVTVDAHQDEAGDMKARLKYIYAHFKFDDIAFITKPNIEFGLVHTPWLDFEEHINYYRMQGTMLMERSKLFNSADFGFTVGGYLGGELDDNYKNNVNSKYPGRYGSFAFGLYNGGGYHAVEKTDNKTFEGRLTVRPLPDIIPGIQFSYFGVIGKGNLQDENLGTPDWDLNAGMISFESKHFVITGTGFIGHGNQKGDLSTVSHFTVNNVADSSFRANDVSGFSVFAEGRIDDNWRVIGRFDNFDSNTDVDDNEQQRIIAGVGYDFGHHNVLILDFDRTFYTKDFKEAVNLLKLTMQIHF